MSEAQTGTVDPGLIESVTAAVQDLSAAEWVVALVAILTFIGLLKDAYEGFEKLAMILRGGLRLLSKLFGRGKDTGDESSFTWDEDDFAEPDTEQYSKYARYPSDLKQVLQVRKERFPDRPVCPDEAYYASQKINDQTFKMVYSDSQFVGYWGLVPVCKDYFDKMAQGQATHEQMITTGALSWEEADPEALYLYIIGVVRRQDSHLTNPQNAGFKIITDAFQTVDVLAQHATIRGAVGYPATNQGEAVLDRHFRASGFVGTGYYADKDQQWEIVQLTQGNVPRFLHTIRQLIEKQEKSAKRHLLVHWDEQDQDRLLTALTRSPEPANDI